MAGKPPRHVDSDDENEVIGYSTRMKLITELHKEHIVSEHMKDELATTEDPKDVYEYQRTQQVKNFTSGTKRRDDCQAAQSGTSQVFRKLDLMPIENIQLSSKEGKGLHRSAHVQHQVQEGDAKTGHSKRHLSHRSRNKRREAEKPVEIIIPLANDRVKTTSIHTDKALHVEYAVRYLEKLGVSPTPANLALVAKHNPLDQCKIQQVFHPGLSKHEKKNYIILRPNQKNAGKSSPSVYDPQLIPFEALPDNLIQMADERDRELERVQMEKRREQHKTAADQGRQGEGDEGTKQASLDGFNEYRDRYLFPYNLKGKHSGRGVQPGEGPSAERLNVLQLAMKKHRPGSGGTTRGAGTPQPAQRSPRVGAASSTSARNKTPDTDVGEGMDGAMTEQRLKLQDGLLALLKKHEEAAKEIQTQFQDRPGSPRNAGDVLEEMDRKDHRAEMMRQMEARAIDGDLSALDEHPEMQRMALVLEDDPNDPSTAKPQSKSQGTSQNDGSNSPVSASMVQSPFADSPTIRTGAGAKENPLAKELAAPPGCDPQQVRVLFQGFVQGFPFATFWSQRERSEMVPEKKAEYDAKVKVIAQDLQSDAMTDFQIQFVLFLYHSLLVPCAEHVVGPAMYMTRAPKRSTLASSSHLQPSPSGSQVDPYHHLRHPAKAMDFDQAFLNVYKQMLDLLLRKRKRQFFSLDLPVTVLAIRVVTDALLRYYYPLFTATELGEGLIEVSNVFVTQLLDPVGFLTHVPALESAPQALKVMHKKRIPTRMPLSFTSPVVRFIVGEARSNEAKVLLATTDKQASSSANGAGWDESGEVNVFALLSPSVRSKLLAIISSHSSALRPLPGRDADAAAGFAGSQSHIPAQDGATPFRPPHAPMVPSQNALKRASLNVLHPGASSRKASVAPGFSRSSSGAAARPLAGSQKGR
eukprot:TRINITY_DN4028_c0_g1_i1.p1 TRINITY_DN4028_c0_g1~~TRINITY_DN4028_c0_g1_i1.p1  ORF type:complete len:922 (+),score=176.74 TRINITY_DN4028_c0_g1_i1:78-2843(+)